MPPAAAAAPVGVPFVEVTRGRLVESVHHVAACATRVAGEPLIALGEIDAPVFLRSAAKPLIAAAVVASGAVDAFGITETELAVMAASHAGEARHVEAVRAILARIDLAEADLRCGVHPPFDAATARALTATGTAPSALHHNCSGKHAGILALARHLGADPATYLDAAHPAQRRILDFCAAALGVRPEELILGVDGCGIPVVAVSLRRAARAFARIAALDGLDDGMLGALERVRTAMQRRPDLVAGTGRFDTALGLATGGAVVGKGGAEGVHADAVPALGVGLVLKVIDGQSRAVAPAALALLDEGLGALESNAAEALATFARPPVFNVAGRIVGEVRARRPIPRPPAWHDAPEGASAARDAAGRSRRREEHPG